MKKIIKFSMLMCLSFYSCKKDQIRAEDVQQEMLAAVNTLSTAGCTCGTTYMPPVPVVKWNDKLEIAAAAPAKDMAVNHYFDHIASNGSSPIQRAQETGYAGMYIGENIGSGYNNIQQVMDAWKKSEEHCKAMMDSLYTELGAARYNTFWVQEFGK